MTCFFKGETKEKERPRSSPDTQKEEEEVAPKRPRLNRRDFKPFDYAGSKFTEFTKGQSVEVSISVLFPGLVYMGMRVCQHNLASTSSSSSLIIHYYPTLCNIIIGTLPA